MQVKEAAEGIKSLEEELAAEHAAAGALSSDDPPQARQVHTLLAAVTRCALPVLMHDRHAGHQGQYKEGVSCLAEAGEPAGKPAVCSSPSRRHAMSILAYRLPRDITLHVAYASIRVSADDLAAGLPK